MPSSPAIPFVPLKVQGYPAQQLSGVRADSISDALGAIHDALFDAAGNPRVVHAAFDRFRAAMTQMGPWDCIKDIFTCGSHKRTILDALARCHVASYEEGRRYLSDLGEYPLRTGESSLYLLRMLAQDVRSVALMPMPDNLCEEPPRLAASGPPIQLWIPGIRLRLPLMPDCFGNGAGAVTDEELEWLMDGRGPGGKSIRQYLSERHDQRTEAECVALACEHETDARTYQLAGHADLAGQLLEQAVEVFAGLPHPEALVRCLTRAAEIFALTGDPSHLIARCQRYADNCRPYGRHFEAEMVGRAIARLHASLGKREEACLAEASADESLFRLGLSCEDAKGGDILRKAIDVAIRCHMSLLQTTGVRTRLGTLFFPEARDPVSGAMFGVESTLVWCLLKRDGRDIASGLAYDLITEHTASALKKRRMHPEGAPLCDDDIVSAAGMLAAFHSPLLF